MGCCGNNSAVVDTSKPPTPAPAPAPKPSPPQPTPEVKPVETAKPKEPEQQVKETPKKPEKSAPKPEETPAPVSETVPEPKVQSVPPSQTQQSVPVSDKVTPSEPKPAVTAPVTKPPALPYLTSIVGPQILQNGKVFPTEATLKRSAAVAIYYASANQDPDTTKKLEVFCAGYEARTLDVIYCPDSDEDVTVVPSAWYELPNDESGALRSNLVNKLSLTSAPTLVIVNPGVEKVLDKTSFDKIINLDPLSSSYDTDACNIFDSWIKGLPMEQDIIREVQIILVS